MFLQANETHEHQPEPTPTDCDRERSNSKIFSDPDCSALFEAAKASKNDICENSCWYEMLLEVGQLNYDGCLTGVNLVDLALQCNSMDEICGAEFVLECADDWIHSGCPLTENPRCVDMNVCFEQRSQECGEQAEPEEETVSLVVALTFNVHATEFRLKYVVPFVLATAKSAGVRNTQVSVLNVKESVIISSAIRVSKAQASAVFHSLESSLASTTFLDNLNAELPTFAQATRVVTLALTTSAVNHGGNDGDGGGGSGGPQAPRLPNNHPGSGAWPPGNNGGPVIVETPSGPGHLSLSHCPNNCSDHGYCFGLPNGKHTTGECICDKGYGRSDPKAVQDCSEFTLSLCPSMCFGHGVCLPHKEEMTCECYDGFFGQTCNRWNRCHDRKFCNGHGSCTRSYPAEEAQPSGCICDLGYTGERCNVQSLDCPFNCGGHGHCGPFVNGSRPCECEPGFGGKGCAFVTGPFCEHSCSANGQCDPITLNCSCVGTAGSDCSTAIRTCGPCGHGYCEDGACKCVGGYKGPTCSIVDASFDSECKRLNFCSGRGLCAPDGGAFSCLCFEGFSGRDCSIVDTAHPEMCPSNCNGHGRCSLKASKFACHCDAGWTGADCSVSACPINDNSVCSGHGVCEAATVNNEPGFACTCDQGFVSQSLGACEHSVCPAQCSGHGLCNNDGTCACVSGFTGVDCSTPPLTNHVVMVEKPAVQAQDQDVPSTISTKLTCLNSCSHHGRCMSGSCECNKGYVGQDCSGTLPGLFEDDFGLDSLELMQMQPRESS
eukprot:c32289_g1_i1.p1 GENE.c32289_g1_i1~~c32289_g1_i1.p1  ORF type:complete len:829 (-),score=123.82 c32289_g1_i1:87-2411(-)